MLILVINVWQASSYQIAQESARQDREDLTISISMAMPFWNHGTAISAQLLYSFLIKSVGKERPSFISPFTQVLALFQGWSLSCNLLLWIEAGTSVSISKWSSWWPKNVDIKASPLLLNERHRHLWQKNSAKGSEKTPMRNFRVREESSKSVELEKNRKVSRFSVMRCPA